MIPIEQISGLVLAGGRGMRMGQVNKGLVLLNDAPMVTHVLNRLRPQVSQIAINVNHDLDQYAQFSCALIRDVIPDYAGPLAGLHAGLLQCTTPYLITAPCDSPFFPLNLVEQMAAALHRQQAQLAVAMTREIQNDTAHWQPQPVFCLVKAELGPHLENFLKNGGRKVRDWYAELSIAEVAFEDASSFRNINTRAELAECTLSTEKNTEKNTDKIKR